MTREVINELKKYTLGKKNTEKVEISVLQLNRVIKALEQEPKIVPIAEIKFDEDKLKELVDKAVLTVSQSGVTEVLDKIRTEIAEYGSICAEYKMTGRSDKDIEQLVTDVLKQAKKQVLEVIDKYKADTEAEDGNDD